MINETTIGPFFKAKSEDEHRSWSVTPFAMSKFPVEVRRPRAQRVVFADEWDQLRDPSP